eukprot:scaffold78979_cov46-Phaeocystis_antarctica.AAC.1
MPDVHVRHDCQGPLWDWLSPTDDVTTRAASRASHEGELCCGARTCDLAKGAPCSVSPHTRRADTVIGDTRVQGCLQSLRSESILHNVITGGAPPVERRP